MVVARSLTDIVEHEQDGAKFLLRMLPHRTMLRLADLSDSQRIELLVRAGIAGWSGVVTSDGTELKCNTKTEVIEGVSVRDALTVDAFEALPFTLLGDLSTAILQANNLMNDEVGN